MWQNNIRGFSLIEVMVSLAIVSLVMATLIGVFVRSNQVYTLQNSTVALQQELRAVIEIMVMEIRMAGFNPMNVKGDKFGIKTATRNELRFTVDWDGDLDEADGAKPGELDSAASKKLTGGCEDRTFIYRPGVKIIQMKCNPNKGDLTPQESTPITLIGVEDKDDGGQVQVTDFQFEYLEGSSVSSNPKQLDWIKGVIITITGEIPAGAQNEPAKRTYKTFVALRNK